MNLMVIYAASVHDGFMVALALNTRPRKTLNWRTHAEALSEPPFSSQ
jgi:IS30 family transposase